MDVTTNDLVQMMQLIETMEKLVQLNRLIADGFVGDPEIIRVVARDTAEQLEFNLIGMKLMLSGTEDAKEAYTAIGKFISED